MGEGFKRIWEWIKAHPYITFGLVGGIFILWYLYSQQQQQAAAAQQQAAAQQGVTGPDDTIQSLEIQSGAQLQAAQIAAQAQGAQYAAELQYAQLQAMYLEQQNNSQNQAALTLGLAQAGESTASILQLLGAQPTATTIPTTVVPTTTAVSTATGTPNQTPAPTNPAPVVPVPQPTTPVLNAYNNGVMYPLVVGSGNTSPDVAQANHGSGTTAPDSNANLYETDVQGTIAQIPGYPQGGTYDVNSAYYATPQATANLADILGTTSVVSPSVVGASGGPFYNPPTEDLITPSGTVDAGQMLSELQNTAPGEWNNILAGYGIQDTASVTSQIYSMFGANQAVPQTTAGGAT